VGKGALFAVPTIAKSDIDFIEWWARHDARVCALLGFAHPTSLPEPATSYEAAGGFFQE
jgi:hypothetical protein